MVDMLAEYAKNIGVIVGTSAPPVALVYRYVLKKRITAAREFFNRVNTATEAVPGLVNDMQSLKDALGPNGGKSIGALVVRTDGRLSLLIDSLSTLTWEARSDGQNVRVNRAFEDWCGWSAADLKGHGWKILLHHDDAHEYEEAWQHSVIDFRPFRYGPMRFVKKDGREETVYVSANPTVVDGGVSFWLGTIEREDKKATL